MKHISDIQAILFDKHFWEKEDVEEYLKTHDYKPIKDIHETKNRYRVRLIEPTEFGHFIIHKIPNHVELVIGFKGEH
jgi:hypothetical protein